MGSLWVARYKSDLGGWHDLGKYEVEAIDAIAAKVKLGRLIIGWPDNKAWEDGGYTVSKSLDQPKDLLRMANERIVELETKLARLELDYATVQDNRDHWQERSALARREEAVALNKVSDLETEIARLQSLVKAQEEWRILAMRLGNIAHAIDDEEVPFCG